MIKLYRTSSEKNRLEKIITNELNINGHLKESTDIVNPTYIIEYNTNVKSYNYCYITEFSRYYFIEGISLVGKTLELSLHEDVLMSHKDSIKNSQATITRSDKGTVYLNDNRIVNTAQHSIVHRKIGAGFTKADTYGIVLASRF